MSIPDFNHNHVLPPHIGNPIIPSDVSPYPCSIMELCERFATTIERITILKKFIAFRLKMDLYGITNGFQWVDGSFTENIELSQSRPPNDLDVVTFHRNLTDDQKDQIVANFLDFIRPSLSKVNYQLDHYNVDFAHDPIVTVEQTRYWIQLFSHNRLGVWKGMLHLELNTPFEDQVALDYLENIII